MIESDGNGEKPDALGEGVAEAIETWEKELDLLTKRRKIIEDEMVDIWRKIRAVKNARY